MIVCDNGTYNLTENSENVDNIFKEDLESGYLDFSLNGHKLNGKFALFKLKGKQENVLLLIKKNEEFAEEDDILRQDKSVILNQIMEYLVG